MGHARKLPQADRTVLGDALPAERSIAGTEASAFVVGQGFVIEALVVPWPVHVPAAVRCRLSWISG